MAGSYPMSQIVLQLCGSQASYPQRPPGQLLPFPVKIQNGSTNKPPRELFLLPGVPCLLVQGWFTLTYVLPVVTVCMIGRLLGAISRGREFPGGPVVRTQCFRYRGHRFCPLVGTLRSHMPRGLAKKKKKTGRAKPPSAISSDLPHKSAVSRQG